MHSILYALLTTGFAVFGALAVGLYGFQNKLVYPSSMAEGRKFVDTPSSYGMPNYDDIALTTRDGVVIKLFVIRHNPEDKKYVNKTILVLCPNAGNMGHSLPIVKLFYKTLGYNVVMLSYRGYGHSTGSPTENGIKIDAETTMEYIANDSQLSSTSLILYGRSLGGAVAIYLAAQPQYNNLIGGVILDNTFLTIRKVIPNILPFLSPFASLCHEVWDSESLMRSGITRSELPFLFLSGANDELVPPAHMKILYELCKSTTKRWKGFEKGTHNDTCLQKHYWDTVRDFIMDDVSPVEG